MACRETQRINKNSDMIMMMTIITIITTRHIILVWNKYRWAGQLKFENKIEQK